jgi:hypothetical protein
MTLVIRSMFVPSASITYMSQPFTPSGSRAKTILPLEGVTVAIGVRVGVGVTVWVNVGVWVGSPGGCVAVGPDVGTAVGTGVGIAVADGTGVGV